MLDNIQPLSTGNGLVAHYTSKHGEAFFGLVIFDQKKSKEGLRDIAAANEQVTGLRRNLTTDPSALETETLKEKFREPQQVRLKPDKDLERVMAKALHKGGDTVFICPDRQTYIQACNNLAITRADHLQAAEMHAALIDIVEKRKNNIAGSAHQFRDLLYMLQYLDQSLIDDRARPLFNGQDRYKRAIIDHFVEEIPEASKIQLGRRKPGMPSYDRARKNLWMLRLPFETCLFEVEHECEDQQSKEKRKAFQKSFILARQMENDLYVAECITQQDRVPVVHDFFLTWKLTGEHAGFAIYPIHQGEQYKEHNRKYRQNAMAFFSIVGEALMQLNDPANRLEKVIAPKHRELSFERKQFSPFYDYHILTPQSYDVVDLDLPETDEEGFSYRLNKRRGHYRFFKHHRFTKERRENPLWVEDWIRGDATQGVIGSAINLDRRR